MKNLMKNNMITTFKQYLEKITIDVKVGDNVLMGKWKNKKTKIKKIGKDEHGMPTINGKKATTFRLSKKEK